jgi:hypothetical protein
VAPGSRTGEPDRSSFTFEVFPGQVIGDTLALTNLTDTPIDFVLWSGDGYNTDDGSFAIYGADVDPVDTGAWVRLPVTKLTVNPRSRATIPFTLTIPETAEPGDHAGGIAALNTTPVDQVDADGADVDVLRAIGARIYLRVAGDLNPDLDIENVRISGHQPLSPTGGGRAVLEYDVVNSGNIRLAPKTTSSLHGPFGLSRRTNDAVELPELLPGSSIRVRQSWNDVSPLIRLTGRIEATAGEEQVVREVTLWAVPWALVILLVLLAAGGLAWRRRRRRPAPSTPPPSARDEELVPA